MDSEKETKKKQAAFECEVSPAFLITFLTCAVAAIAFLCVLTFKESESKQMALDAAYAGTIVDKNGPCGVTDNYYPIRDEYRLYIDVTYKTLTGTKTVQKYFAVPISTYLAYDIGDYFDSHSFTYSEQEGSDAS